MNDPIAIRKQIRVILSALPEGRPASEELILATLGRFFPEPVSVPQMQGALQWNQARGYIDFRTNRDEDRVEWFLTRSGRDKEGIA